MILSHCHIVIVVAIFYVLSNIVDNIARVWFADDHDDHDLNDHDHLAVLTRARVTRISVIMMVTPQPPPRREFRVKLVTAGLRLTLKRCIAT